MSILLRRAASSISLSRLFTSLSLDSYFKPSTSDQVYSGNRRIDSFIKSGDLQGALKVFDEMLVYDVVSYNLLISGHAKFGLRRQAILLYAEMFSRGMRESASTLSSVLASCSNGGFYREGVQVHCRAVCLGFGSNVFVGSSLVDLYLHMGMDNVAVELFDELPKRNLAVWNLLLRGKCEVGRFGEVYDMYTRMRRVECVDPNGVSYCYWIRACSNGKMLDEGKQLHCCVVKEGWLVSNVFVANGLVDFYSACGSLIDARDVFEGIDVEDVISWNSIVWVHAENGLVYDALELFARMQVWGKRPSVRSFVGFLNLASRSQDVQFGKQVHSYVVKSGFDHGGSFYVQSALIDMYGKCSDIKSSVYVYENGHERSLKCCNSLMTSLLHCGVVEDVVELFGFMVDEGVGLDEVSLSTVLKALSVSAFASLGSCKLLHCCAVKPGFESDIAVSCSLIDAYARCGNVKLARQVFDDLPAPTVICFTSIIHGYARNGVGSEGIHLLQDMVGKGLKPDKVTILGVLSGCNHSGLVGEAKMLFESMEILFGVTPDRKHYSCMVDLLGRAGLLEEAEVLLRQAPAKGDCVLWSSLLQSCRAHRNEIVGRRTVMTLLELEGKNPAILLQASNFYSEIGEFHSALKMKEFSVAQQVPRDIGHSLVEITTQSQVAY